MTALEKKYEKLLNKNEADSYLVYTAKKGERIGDKFYDTLAKADTNYRLSDSNYGAGANYLSDSGLNGSGYEDYLRGQNDKRFVEKISGGRLQEKIDKHTDTVGYKNYLSNYESMQAKISESVIKEIGAESNFSIEAAYEKAVRAGIAKNLAYITAEAGVIRAKENTVQKAIQYAKINNLTANGAKDYALQLGLDESYANKVYNEIAALTEKEKNFYANMTSKDYYDYIKSQAGE